jgi:hypothetical protein
VGIPVSKPAGDKFSPHGAATGKDKKKGSPSGSSNSVERSCDIGRPLTPMMVYVACAGKGAKFGGRVGALVDGPWLEGTTVGFTLLGKAVGRAEVGEAVEGKAVGFGEGTSVGARVGERDVGDVEVGEMEVGERDVGEMEGCWLGSTVVGC